MKDMWDRLLSGILSLAAVSMAVALVHREFFLSAGSSNERRKSEYVSDWQDLKRSGHLVGASTAPISIVEFSDLQCPFCRRFHTTLQLLRNRFPDRVNYAFVHYPLRGHGHAVRAAQAVECASGEGRFEQTVDFVFANQDSLGKRNWTWFARGAGVRDTMAFAVCMADSASPPIVSAGLAAGQRLNVTGTPTILLNGWRYAGVPLDTELVRAVDDLLAGRRPYKAFPKRAVPLPEIAASR